VEGHVTKTEEEVTPLPPLVYLSYPVFSNKSIHEILFIFLQLYVCMQFERTVTNKAVCKSSVEILQKDFGYQKRTSMKINVLPILILSY